MLKICFQTGVHTESGWISPSVIYVFLLCFVLLESNAYEKIFPNV